MGEARPGRGCPLTDELGRGPGFRCGPVGPQCSQAFSLFFFFSFSFFSFFKYLLTVHPMLPGLLAKGKNKKKKTHSSIFFPSEPVEASLLATNMGSIIFLGLPLRGRGGKRKSRDKASNPQAQDGKGLVCSQEKRVSTRAGCTCVAGRGVVSGPARCAGREELETSLLNG